MRLQHLQLILMLAETGSLRAAAERLNVTQPALTKALRQLEDEFGTAMVLRSPKGVRLTPAGELLAARAASAMRELDRAREEVAWQLRHAKARVSIGVSPAAAIVLMPGALARLRARWPQVRVQVLDALYPRALTMVRAGELDLVAGPLPPEGAGRDLHVQPLFDAQQVLVARAGHPLARATRLAELQQAAWVVTGSPHGPGDPANLGFDRLGLATPPVLLECESFSTLVALLPSVDAIGIMPQGFFDHYAARLGVIRLPIEDPLPRVTVHAAWRADAPLTAPAGRLLDALEQEARAVREPRLRPPPPAANRPPSRRS
jgi:LysR family transcriptional regulator, regulator of abg operon